MFLCEQEQKYSDVTIVKTQVKKNSQAEKLILISWFMVLRRKCITLYHIGISFTDCFQCPGYDNISGLGHSVLQGKVQSMTRRSIFVSFEGKISVVFASYWPAQNSVSRSAQKLDVSVWGTSLLIYFFLCVYFLNVTCYFTGIMLWNVMSWYSEGSSPTAHGVKVHTNDQCFGLQTTRSHVDSWQCQNKKSMLASVLKSVVWKKFLNCPLMLRK